MTIKEEPVERDDKPPAAEVKGQLEYTPSITLAFALILLISEIKYDSFSTLHTLNKLIFRL